MLKRIGELYDIHPLSIEDVLYTEQQPKVETFKEYRFLSMKTIQNAEDDFLIDQISLIIYGKCSNNVSGDNRRFV